ncbi:MAG: hypothetical protein WCL23_05280 [Candidatus Moraniibacteriota bacterium]
MTKHHITEHSHSHFKGRGMWVWNEIHGNDNDYEPYVRMAKAYGIQYVVIKAYNGGNWGVRDAEGDFQTQLNQRMISAFQKAGIRCYGCGTAYLWPQSDVEGAIRHSVNLLHKTTVDGIVLDDVFAYGADKHQTGRLFGEIRNHIDHCSSCRKKAFAFSTFPYVWKADLPWEIPFRYARYYLPQIYWMDMRLTPSGAVSRFQRGWNEYHRKNRNVHVRIIPVGPTIDHRDVTPKHVKQFISACRKDGYHDISFFRWGVTSKEKWKVIGGKS